MQFKAVLREPSQALWQHEIPLQEVGLELSLEGWQRGSKEDISSGGIGVSERLGLRNTVRVSVRERALMCLSRG